MSPIMYQVLVLGTVHIDIYLVFSSVFSDADNRLLFHNQLFDGNRRAAGMLSGCAKKN